MSIQDHKLPQANTTIQDLADYPAQSGLTAQQLKAKFDEYPEKLRRAVNGLIDELAEYYPDQGQLEAILAGTGLLSEHLGQLAGETSPGHVRLDGRTITLNQQGQLTALGGEVELASLDEALAGAELSKVMTPYLVKEAITHYKQRVQVALEQIWQSDLQITAADWHEAGSFLAAAVSDGGTHAVVLYTFDTRQLRESSRVAVSGPVESLLWREYGTALAYRLRDGSGGVINKDGSKLVAATTPPLGQCRLLGWESARLVTDRRLVAVREDDPTRLQVYEDSMGSWQFAETVDLGMGGEMGEILLFAFMPYDGSRLALVDRLDGQCRLRFFEQELVGYVFQSQIDLKQQPTVLSWRPGGGMVALGYGEGDLAVQLFANTYFEPTIRLVDSLPGGTVAGLSWHRQKQMLAVGFSGAEPAYTIYDYNGQALQPLVQGAWPEAAVQVLFNRGNDYLALIGQAQEQSGISIHKLTREVTQRFLPLTHGAQAVAYGDYLLPTGQKCQIRCFAEPQPGQYFRFVGAYPQEVSVDGGAYAVRDSLSESGEHARGRGLYQVIFVKDDTEAGGSWRILALNGELANLEQARAAEEDTRALTPYGGGQLLAARGRRAATLVIAAADSLNPQAADFVCSGQQDQLVIKAALAALPESGGRLVLLDGTFHFDGEGFEMGSDNRLRMLSLTKPNVSISGMGSSTRLRVMPGSAQISNRQFVMFYVDAPDFVLEDCCLDGNRYNNNQHNLTGLAFGSLAQRAEVRRCRFTAYSAVALQGLKAHGQISDSWFYDNAVGIDSEQGDFSIMHNQFSQHSTCGVYCHGGQDSLQNNRFRNNKVGLELDGCVDSMVDGNQLVENITGAILRSCTSIYVKDNYVRRGTAASNYGTTEYSLLLDSCKDLLMVGNWFRYKCSTPINGWQDIWASFSGTDWNPEV